MKTRDVATSTSPRQATSRSAEWEGHHAALLTGRHSQLRVIRGQADKQPHQPLFILEGNVKT